MIKFLAGSAMLIWVCILSFNYVEGHESTRRDQTIKEQIEEIGRLKTETIGVAGKLRQACSLLKTAEIENVLCGEPESKEPQSQEDSDD